MAITERSNKEGDDDDDEREWEKKERGSKARRHRTPFGSAIAIKMTTISVGNETANTDSGTVRARVANRVRLNSLFSVRRWAQSMCASVFTHTHTHTYRYTYGFYVNRAESIIYWWAV